MRSGQFRIGHRFTVEIATIRRTVPRSMVAFRSFLTTEVLVVSITYPIGRYVDVSPADLPPVPSADIRTHIEPGSVVRIRIGYAEVCVHMGVAGRVFPVAVETDGAYLLGADGRRYPHITHGEAGISRPMIDDESGFYVHVVPVSLRKGNGFSG